MRLAAKLVFAMTVAAAVVVWYGCAEKITNDRADQYNVAIKASLGDAAQSAAVLDPNYHYRLVVTARDMDPIDTLLEVTDDGFIVGRVEVPSGLARHFVLTAEQWDITTPVTHVGPDDTTIAVIFRGEKTIDIIGGQEVRLSISMRPMIPMVKLSPKYTVDNGGHVIDLEIKVFNVPDLYDISMYFDLDYEALSPIEIVRGDELGDNVGFDGYTGDGVYVSAGDTSNPNSPVPIVDAQGDVTIGTLRLWSRVIAGDPLPESYCFPYSISAVDVPRTPALGDSLAIDTAYLTVRTIDDMIVTFPDTELDNAIRSALYIQATDTIWLSTLLNSLNYFYAQEAGITDLTNLNYARNLETLELGYNNIGDYTPLGELTGLRSLALQYGEAPTIAPLASLILLYSLNLDYAGVSDLTPLRFLDKLEVLYLVGNNIVSLAPLTQLPELNYVDLSYNQITDILPLVQNTGIGQYDYVDLTGNPLSATSVDVYIPQLIERGATVNYMAIGAPAQ